jgi:hypothetical protein
MLPAERRAFFRTGLSTLYAPHYDNLCSELPPEWAPYYGLRTFAEQDGLYAKGRTVQGEPCHCKIQPCLKHPLGLTVTEAKGGESGHNYGCSSDWTVWADKKPIWMKIDDPRWPTYLKAIARVRLRSGSTFPKPDYPHNQLQITCSWKRVAGVYAQTGMTGAQQHIEKNLLHA